MKTGNIISNATCWFTLNDVMVAPWFFLKKLIIIIHPVQMKELQLIFRADLFHLYLSKFKDSDLLDIMNKHLVITGMCWLAASMLGLRSSLSFQAECDILRTPAFSAKYYTGALKFLPWLQFYVLASLGQYQFFKFKFQSTFEICRKPSQWCNTFFFTTILAILDNEQKFLNV